jgi:hypothetical protein
MATLKNSTINDGIVELPDHGSAPSPTAGALYANTTSLYWEDNDLVAGGGGGAADKQTTGNTLSNSAATDSGPSQGYRLAPNASTTLGVIAKANTFMQGTFYNEVILLGDVVAPGLYIRGEGTDNSQAITEQGPTGHTLTVVNDTKYENTVALPWSTTSIFFDGTADKITAPRHSDFDMLARGDYTVELWVQFSDHAGTETLLSYYEDASNAWVLEHIHGTGLNFSASSAEITDFNLTGTEIADTLWHHVAVVKGGRLYSMYLDGKLVNAVTSTDVDTLAGTLQIGDAGGGSKAFQGYMAEIRLTKGMTRYSGNFDPAQGYLSARMASFAIDATTFHSTDTPITLDIGSRDRLGEDTTGDGGHCQVEFPTNYSINSTAYMIPISFRNTSGHEFSLNYNIWPRSYSNTYMLASESVAVFSASAFYGNRGLFAGGTGASDVIDYFTIGTVSETAIDFGNLTQARTYVGGASNGSRAVFCGGNGVDTIDFVTVASTGNATDFGELSDARQTGASTSDGSRAVTHGGYDGSAYVNTMDFITISTKGNARDYGDQFDVQAYSPTVSNGSRGVQSGGYGPTINTNIISFITIGQLGNSIDYGDLPTGKRLAAGTSDGSRGVICGGRPPATNENDDMEYFNISVLSNAVDWGGESTDARSHFCATANGSRALWAGGSAPPTLDTVDYTPIGVAGVDAVDFGELSQARHDVPASASGD